ncbi:MAG: hypothetical protein ACREQV_22025 [Candidatus Binatia bacterium]
MLPKVWEAIDEGRRDTDSAGAGERAVESGSGRYNVRQGVPGATGGAGHYGLTAALPLAEQYAQAIGLSSYDRTVLAPC